MRRLIALAVTLLASSACAPAESTRPAPEPPPAVTAFDLGDLRFADYELNEIARARVQQARTRGITTVSATSKIDALVTLESMLDATPMALDRFNALTRSAMSSDASNWSALRRRSRRRFAGSDAASQRVQALLDDWEHRKLRLVADALSSPQWKWNFSDKWWELEFHDFVRRRPLHAATWGWLVLGEKRDEIQKQYGTSDIEHGYRFYLELSRFGAAEEARDLFSLPGITSGLH